MEKQDILSNMFQAELSQMDVKAIGRCRGFSSAEMGSRELVQHMFLSEAGVASAMASLTDDEVRLLHLMNCLGQVVDISFFERVYDSGGTTHIWGTFNERYKGVFRQVHSGLIRKGLLLFHTEPKGWSGQDPTILERRRFLFPADFAPFLPAPIRCVQIADAAGPTRSDVLRKKLLEVLGQGGTTPLKAGGAQDDRLHIVGGELRLGKGAFGVKRMTEWQIGRFEKAVKLSKKPEFKELSPVRLTLYALATLADNEWAEPKDLLPLWMLAPPESKPPDVHAVCEAGCRWGCLERMTRDRKLFIRLSQVDDAMMEAKPDDYLDMGDREAVAIDVQHVPIPALEWLNRISIIKVRAGRLWAYPDLVKISHAPETLLQHSLSHWLRGRHQAFDRAVQTVSARKGRTIVHENLMIARIKDLSLKVAIRKEFPNQNHVVSLSEEFIAFPRDLLLDIERLLKKTGHVIKTIAAQDEKA